LGALIVWVGFAIRHVGKKLAIGAGIAGAAILSTKSGRKIVKVMGASIKGAAEAAIQEIKCQRAAAEDEVKK
jgi:hypothetical protein